MLKTLSPLRPYLWRYRKPLALGMGALVIKDVLGAVGPLLIREAFDAFQAGKGVRGVAGLAGLLVLVAALKGVFQYAMRVILIGASRDIEYDLRNDLFARLVRLDSGFYGRNRTGDIMARATNDLNAVRMMLGPGLMYWTETGLTFLLAIGVMLSFDWKLTLLTIAPAPLVSIAVILFGRKIHDRFERIQEMFSDISSRVQENLAGVRMVRAFAQEDAEIDTFRVLNEKYVGENIRLARLSGIFEPMLEALIGLTFFLVLLAGGSRVIDGTLSIGEFVMFNTYMGMLVWPMIALGWVINLMQRGTASYARIQEIMTAEPSIAAPARPAPLSASRGEIEFRGVTVRHGETVALDRVNVRIAAGSTVAIVGRTGAGKSTFVNLIPRLLDPSDGSVLLDGVDLREFDPGAIRGSIGFVPQETFLFSATLGQNIAFGAPSASQAGIERAAAIAGLAPDIEGFPQGYETLVGERGVTLSGGQKQRTAIARALIRDPRILILDDALSAVDTLTEERILTSLEDLLRDRTVILISHRVSTVRGADAILVLDRGRIVEQGTHAELLALGGYYADLAARQALEEELEAI